MCARPSLAVQLCVAARCRCAKFAKVPFSSLLSPLLSSHSWLLPAATPCFECTFTLCCICQILPRQVLGLGRRVVVAVAAAKHHTLVATSAGEVFSFGSNKDGRLGYPAVDTQPTPRK